MIAWTHFVAKHTFCLGLLFTYLPNYIDWTFTIIIFYISQLLEKCRFFGGLEMCKPYYIVILLFWIICMIKNDICLNMSVVNLKVYELAYRIMQYSLLKAVRLISVSCWSHWQSHHIFFFIYKMLTYIQIVFILKQCLFFLNLWKPSLSQHMPKMEWIKLFFSALIHCEYIW